MPTVAVELSCNFHWRTEALSHFTFMRQLISPTVPKEGAKSKSRKRRLGFKAVLCLGAALASVTAVVLWVQSPKGSKIDSKSVVPEEAALKTVPVAKAIRADLTKDISLYAEFRPYQEIMLHAKVSGYVQYIRADIGDHVKAGGAFGEVGGSRIK